MKGLLCYMFYHVAKEGDETETIHRDTHWKELPK